MKTTSSPRSVTLRFEEDSESVSVVPGDSQRFKVAKSYAIEALRMAKEQEVFEQKFQLLLNTLGAWAKRHVKSIDQVYLTLQDSNLRFVVVGASPTFDAALSEDLSQLDSDVAADRQIDLPVDMILLPPVSECGLQSFLDPRLVLVYHG